MNCVSLSADFEPLVSRNSSREKVRDALRLHVGRGRRFSVRELAVGAGVDDKSVERAMRPIDAPDYRALKHEELLSIAKFLGAGFVSHYLELAGLGAFELMDGQPPLPRILATADAGESPSEERKRLIRRLAEIEELN